MSERAQSGRKVVPYLAYTSGAEYTFYSVFGSKHDLGTIAEIIGDTDTGKDPADLESFRPWRNNAVGGLRYAFNNTSDRSHSLALRRNLPIGPSETAPV